MTFYKWCLAGFPGLPTKKIKTTTLGRSAFKQVHAVLVADYTEQRSKLLAPGKAELARLRGAEAFKLHTAAARAVQEWPDLRLRPAYNSVYLTVLKGFKTKGPPGWTLMTTR